MGLRQRLPVATTACDSFLKKNVTCLWYLVLPREIDGAPYLGCSWEQALMWMH